MMFFNLFFLVPLAMCNNILVLDMEKPGCPEVHEKAFMTSTQDNHVVRTLQRNRKSILEDCGKFNISLVVSTDLSRNTVSAVFESIPVNSTCLHFYEVHFIKKSFTAQDSFSYETLCVLHDIQAEGQVKLKFINLKNGTYLLYIFPCKWKQDSPDICEITFSSNDIVIIDNTPQVLEKRSLDDSNTSRSTKIALFCLPIILLVLIIFVISYKRFRTGVSFEASHSVANGREPIQNCDLISPRDIEILILHSHDEETREKVELLGDFLQNCAKFSITLMSNEIAEIIISPQSWIMGQIQYECSNLGDPVDSNKRILLVEPEKALFSKNSQEMEYEIENNLYQCILHTLRTDWKRCLSDYCHIFVVHFDYFNKETEYASEFVPGTRYVIPDHLIKLCLDLSMYNGSNLDSFNNMLSSYLKSHEIRKLKT